MREQRTGRSKVAEPERVVPTFEFKGAQIAAIWRDWKEAWDGGEMAASLRAVMAANPGAKIVTREPDTMADFYLMVFVPDTLEASDDELMEWWDSDDGGGAG